MAASMFNTEGLVQQFETSGPMDASDSNMTPIISASTVTIPENNEPPTTQIDTLIATSVKTPSSSSSSSSLPPPPRLQPVAQAAMTIAAFGDSAGNETTANIEMGSSAASVAGALVVGGTVGGTANAPGSTGTQGMDAASESSAAAQVPLTLPWELMANGDSQIR